MARNIEVLRNYFLGKDPQLKETMADNSLRLIGIPGKHFVLRTELLKRLQALQDELEDADEGLLALINTVDGRVALERSERIQHDNTIMGKVNDNVTAIMNLGNALSLERDARQSADRQINGRIDTNSTNIAYIQDWIDNTDFVLDEDLAAALENYYTKAQVNQLISTIPTFDIEVVQTLPVQDISDTTIYLVPSQDPQTANSYDEFIHVNNAWEQIGSTAIDLSDYYTKTETDNLLDNKQDALTPGDNISIVNNVISTTGYEISKLENGTKIWDLDTGIYEADSTVSIYYDAAGTVSGPFKGVLFVYNNTTVSTKYWYSFGETESLRYGNVTANSYFRGGMDISFNYQNKNDKVISISSSSTDTQYPSAKCVYDAIQNAREIEELTSTTINIWELQAGFYKIKVPSGSSTQVYYKSTNPKTLYYDTYLIVTDTLDTDADDMKYFYLFLQPYQLVDVGETSYEGFSDFVVGWSEKWGNNQIKGAAKTIKLGNVQFKSNLVTSISASSTDTQYPSAKCVYDALQNAGRGITHLTVDSNIWQLDEGVYMPPLNGYLYYDPNDNTKRINIIYEGLLVIDKSVADTVKYALYMGKRIATGTIDMLMGISTIEAVQCQTTSNLVTSMSSSSTDTQYPSAKCVYDALQNAGGTTITYGTTDLTPRGIPIR